MEELPTSHPPSNSGPSDPTGLKAYRFPYPTKFLSIPYHTDTSLEALSSQIVPLARTSRPVEIDVPIVSNATEPVESAMEIDQKSAPVTAFAKQTTEIAADGLLLYMAEASYEAGTSPLSTWIPIANYEESHTSNIKADSIPSADGPLDIFHR